MMADELLNAQDLITAKKHDTFHSEVITGKTGGVSTGANIDYATNAVTGQVQKTLPKVINDLDWSYVGLFADGVTFTDKTDFAVDAVGTQWIYTGSLPFSATAGTVPSEPTYQVVHVKSASAISNANGGSVQDFIDEQDTDLATVASGVFPVGVLVRIAEYGYADYKIVSGGVVNTPYIISAGTGKTAVLKSSKGYAFSPELMDKNIEIVEGTIRQQQPITVVSLTRPAGTSGVVVETSHGRAVGDYVVISGATPTGYNGTHEIIQVDNADTYRVLVDSGLTSPATGTIKVFGADWWEWIKDSTHEPSGVNDSVPVRSDASGVGLLIPLAKTYSRVLSILATPDETIAGAQGMVVGGSISLNGLALRASLNKTIAGRVYFDGSVWRVSMGTDQGKIYTYDAPYPFKSINYLGGNLELNHSFCLGEDVSLTACSTGGVVPYIPVLKVIGDNNATINFMYVNPTTHALDLYTGAQNTSMSFRFNKNSNRQIKFDGSDRSSETGMYFGNIWIFGIMEV